ncbi:hypothetical protein A9Q84_10855 [Halobacteriovorax marinus]|uniref:Uncharacterized protein n=1 Tax=Halobacteriovorax marinus TaxID=97084 RepID=A0A1Y5FCZ6_9BACT|nr:hypothetical protein A9Q84_10855 [Halobacteriovorax marinus]
MKKIILLSFLLSSCASVNFDKTPIKEISSTNKDVLLYKSTRIESRGENFLEKALYIFPYISETKNKKSWRMKIETHVDALYYNKITYQCDQQDSVSFTSDIEKWNKTYQEDCTNGDCFTVETADIAITKDFIKGILDCKDKLKFTATGTVRSTSRSLKVKFNKNFYQGLIDLKKVMN